MSLGDHKALSGKQAPKVRSSASTDGAEERSTGGSFRTSSSVGTCAARLTREELDVQKRESRTISYYIHRNCPIFFIYSRM
jgi:hypothetical protein